jgi:hypothetical protein
VRLLNGLEIVVSPDEQETMVLAVAAGSANWVELTAWLEFHVRPTDEPA